MVMLWILFVSLSVFVQFAILQPGAVFDVSVNVFNFEPQQIKCV